MSEWLPVQKWEVLEILNLREHSGSIVFKADFYLKPNKRIRR